MSKKVFKEGDRVYLSTGAKAYYVEALSSGRHLVEMEIYYEDDVSGGILCVVEKVHSTPPIVKKSKELENLNKKNVKAKEELAKIYEQIAEAQAQDKIRIDEMNKIPGLKAIEGFLKDEITHIVKLTFNGEVIVTPLKDALKLAENHGTIGKPLRMLSLFGDTRTDKRFAWFLNRYSDGSGTWEPIIPCRSEQEAIEEARKIVKKQLTEKSTRIAYINRASKVSSYFLKKNCEAFDIPVPNEIIQELNEAKRKHAMLCLKKAEDAKKEADKILGEIEKTEVI